MSPRAGTGHASLSARVYRAFLVAFPRSVREAFGDDMTDQFDLERRARSGRPLGLIHLWVTGLLDVLWHGLRARVTGSTGVSARGAAVPYGVPGSRRRPGAAVAIDGLQRDLRMGVRRLASTPAFTLVGVLTLALGIGANSAIFSVVNAVLLRPLPFPDAERLVSIHHVWEGSREVLSPPNFLDAEVRTQTLAAATAYRTTRVVLTGSGEPESLVAGAVSAAFFDTLRTPPLLGRPFVRDEHETGAAPVVILSHRLWRSRFNGARDVIGRSVVIDGRPREVVGVMPEGFRWPLDAVLWQPIEYDESFTTTNRGAWYLSGVGRLRDGVAIDAAIAEFEAIGRQLEAEYPRDNARVGLTLHPLHDTLVGDSRTALLVLLAAVGLVLLIACANVANLLLARASARRDEFAVRAALGARRFHLARQVLVESLVLATAGGLTGLLLAVGGTRLLVSLEPEGVPRLAEVGVDPAVLGVTALVTLITGLVFGLAPALQTSQHAIGRTLHERGRSGTGSRRAHRARSALVVVETALAVILLAGAGLLVKSFTRLADVDPGFNLRDAVVFDLALPAARYPGDPERLVFWDRAFDAFAAIPGVKSVGSVLAVPPAGSRLNLTFTVEGRADPEPGNEPTLEVSLADGAYFRTMGIPIVAGRVFEDTDRADAPPVLVLTESAVRRYFPNEDPIGQRMTLGWGREAGPVGGTVIGVVGDVKSVSLAADAPQQVYVPLSQITIGRMSIVMATTGDPASVIPSLRATVAGLDPDLPLTGLGTLDEHLGASISQQRFYMLLLAIFAAVAVTLAGAGLFGVLSYLVSQRRREIGVRMALGASAASVVWLVVGRAAMLAAVGIALGLAAALAMSGVLRTLVFDLSVTDPETFAGVAVALMTVALCAAWLPARRAVRVDPLGALRAD